MAFTTFSTRNFRLNTHRAMRAAEEGPVIITEAGRPTHVLLSFEQYRKVSGKQKTLAEMLAMDAPDQIDPDFEFGRLGAERATLAKFER